MTAVRIAAVLSLAVAVGAAEDPWAKVKELKSGQEVRVLKKAGRAPVLGVFDELTEDNLIVVVKSEQTAIARDQIDRIDARPVQKGSRVKTEGSQTVTDPEPRRGRPNESRTPGTNISSGVSIGGKPEFETVFRRTASAPVR